MSEQWHYEQKGESYIKVDTLHKIRTLESSLAAVTEQLKAAQDGWRDEITKGLSELRRAESIYTQAQERAERAEEQRDRLAEALKEYREALHDGPENCSYKMYEAVDEFAEQALQSLNPDHTVDANDMIAAVKGGADE